MQEPTPVCGAELTPLPSAVQRVAAVLLEKNHPHAPRMLAESARTAQEAADALGVALGQIAKSIVLRRRADDSAVLVVTSGDRRVDTRKVEALLGPLGRADADFVKARTGFTIGGVAPVGHLQPPTLLLDVDLFRFEQVWAAAGHSHAVFPASPIELCRLTGAMPANVVEGAPDKLASQAHVRLLERVQAVRQLPQQTAQALVPSPCMSVCTMDAQRAFCMGCLRTIDEIRAWSSLPDADKRVLWERIAQRASEHVAAATPSSA